MISGVKFSVVSPEKNGFKSKCWQCRHYEWQQEKQKFKFGEKKTWNCRKTKRRKQRLSQSQSDLLLYMNETLLDCHSHRESERDRENERGREGRGRERGRERKQSTIELWILSILSDWLLIRLLKWLLTYVPLTVQLIHDHLTQWSCVKCLHFCQRPAGTSRKSFLKTFPTVKWGLQTTQF